MKIRYTAGPKTLHMGAAGRFTLNKFREVNDKLARSILKKKSYPWEAEKKGAQDPVKEK